MSNRRSLLSTTFIGHYVDLAFRQSDKGESDRVFVDGFVKDDTIHSAAEVYVDFLLQYLNVVIQPKNTKHT